MKRLIILFIVFISFFTSEAFGTCNYLNLCPKNYYLSSQTSQFLSNTTGTTFLAEQFAQNIIAKELKDATNQNFTVNLKAFSLADLIEGKFKSLSVSGTNINLQGVNISHIAMQTLCGFNHIDIQSRTLKFKENMVLGFWAEISGQDIKNTLSYGDYAHNIESLDASPLGLSSFRIYPASINIKNNKIYFTINALPSGQKQRYDINVNSNIKIKNGNVITSNINFLNTYNSFDLTRFPNELNPGAYLNFPTELCGNKVEIQILNLNFIDNKMFVDGIIFIQKT